MSIKFVKKFEHSHKEEGPDLSAIFLKKKQVIHEKNSNITPVFLKKKVDLPQPKLNFSDRKL